MYYSNNENSIKMNDSMIDVFFVMYNIVRFCTD